MNEDTLAAGGGSPHNISMDEADQLGVSLLGPSVFEKDARNPQSKVDGKYEYKTIYSNIL